MPTEDVSDLRDVVDAINKLCETMKTSYDEYEDCEDIQDDTESVSANNTVAENIKFHGPEKCVMAEIMTKVETNVAAESDESVAELVISDPVATHETNISDDIYMEQVTLVPETDSKVGAQNAETSSNDEGMNNYIVPDISVSKPVTVKPEPHQYAQSITEESMKVMTSNEFDPVVYDSGCVTVELVPEKDKWGDKAAEIVVSFTKELEADIKNIDLTVSDSGAELAPCEPTSEMYYTASSEVSLLSDIDLQDKAQSEDSDKEKDDRNSVIAGHVAAMRERFESMTRTNTPCPDLIRSTSPSFEVFRNLSTSPDHLE